MEIGIHSFAAMLPELIDEMMLADRVGIGSFGVGATAPNTRMPPPPSSSPPRPHARA